MHADERHVGRVEGVVHVGKVEVMREALVPHAARADLTGDRDHQLLVVRLVPPAEVEVGLEQVERRVDVGARRVKGDDVKGRPRDYECAPRGGRCGCARG